MPSPEEKETISALLRRWLFAPLPDPEPSVFSQFYFAEHDVADKCWYVYALKHDEECKLITDFKTREDAVKALSRLDRLRLMAQYAAGFRPDLLPPFDANEG